MVVNTTWTNPTVAVTSGGLDFATGNTIDEATLDRLVSNEYRLGGTDGDTKTGKWKIDQAAADDSILEFISSDVVHGVTNFGPTNTYALFGKQSGTDGGLSLYTFRDTGTNAMEVVGIHVTDDTAKTTGASAVFLFDGRIKSGVGTAAVGANANILAIRTSGVTRFIFDGEGDSHQDVGTSWTNFSDHDDAGLLNTISAHVTRPDDPLRERFRDFLNERREQLEELRLVTFNEDGHHFVNMSRLTMLLVGAAIQADKRIKQLEGHLLPSVPG